MTVSSTAAVSGPYVGNGSTVAFPFTFKAMSAAEVVVFADGAEISSGLYSVSLATVGGTVTLTTAPASGVSIVIVSNPSFLQDIDLENNGAFRAATFDEAHDRAAVRDIYLRAMLQSVLPAGGLVPGSGAGKFIARDAEGNPVFSSGTGADAGLREDLADEGGSALVSYLPSGDDAVLTSVQAQLRGALYINVRNFRIGGDPDDALSITRAAAYAKSLRSQTGGAIDWQGRQAVLHFPPNLEFEIASPVQIPGNVSVRMESPVVVTAAAGALPSDFDDDDNSYVAWIDIGEDVEAYNRGSRWCRFDISVIRETQSNWASLDDLGVRFQNIQSSDIRLNRILGFARNVEFYAGAYCIAFNHVTIGDIRGAKRHLTLNAGPATLPFNDQFVNHNQFYGGEFANGSGEGNGTSDIVGIYLEGGNDEAYNNNFFYNQSYEFTTSGEALAAWAEGKTTNCHWLGQRTESLDVGMRVSHAESEGCYFDDRYFPFDISKFTGTALLSDDDSRAQANRQAPPWKPLYDNLIPVWDSGMISKRANQYDGSTAYAVGGFDIAASDFSMSAGATLIDISGDVIRHEAGRDLVRWIDTSVNKRFVFIVYTGDQTKPWSPRFRAYDSGGSLLVPVETPASSGIFLPSYVNAISSTMFAWNAGIYATGAYVPSGPITSYHLFVSFHSSVAKVAFALAGSGTIGGGTAHQKKRVQIMAVDSPSATWIETRAPFDNGEFIGTAAPTAGTWKRGTRVYNITPSAAGTEGWICTAAGTPGTWKTFGVIAA